MSKILTAARALFDPRAAASDSAAAPATDSRVDPANEVVDPVALLQFRSKLPRAPDGTPQTGHLPALLGTAAEAEAAVHHLGHPTKTAFRVPHFLSAGECRALIARSEMVGYTAAKLNTGNGDGHVYTDIRNSGRSMVDDPILADALWARVQHYVPQELTKHRWHKNGDTIWRPRGLNERLRFLRYHKGHYFVQHMDGNYARPKHHPLHGDVSHLTMLIYLNDAFEGGELALEWCGERLSTGEWGRVSTDIAPTPGLCVIHDHKILHEAKCVLSGVRYCIRTDIMYTPDEDEVEEEKAAAGEANKAIL